MSDNPSNYIEETTPLFRLLRTEAFRFVIVRYNHYLLVNQLKEDLKLRFPDRPSVTIDGRKTDYRSLVDSYYNAASGFFFIENFDEILVNPQIYTGLNQRRDKLATYPIALIVFVSSSTVELFARQIMEKLPDLWSFRSLLLDLKVEYLQTVHPMDFNSFIISEPINLRYSTFGGSIGEEKEQELDRLLKRVNEVPETELELLKNIYQQIARLYTDLSEYDKALSYFQSLKKLQILIGDKQGEGVTLNDISEVYMLQCDYDTAFEYQKRSLNIAQKIGDRHGEGDTLNNIALVYFFRGVDATALGYLEQSLTIRQEIGDKEGEGTTLNIIGTINYRRGEYDTALEYLKRSLIIRQEIGDKQGEGSTLNNISMVYKLRGDYDTALWYLKRSLSLGKEIGNRQDLVTPYFNMGQLLIKKGDKRQGNDYIILAGYLATNLGKKGDLTEMTWALDPLIKEMGNEKFMEEGKRLYEQIVINKSNNKQD